MIIKRIWEMPNSKTFEIFSIRELIYKYINKDMYGIDPFANNCKIATITNDLNDEFDTDYNMDAYLFLKQFNNNQFDYILYDPPYSITQASRVYKNYGKEKLEHSVSNMKYWSSCKDECARILKSGGIIISFGWNSNGIGNIRGFTILEIKLIAHGGGRHDTICVVEQKNPALF